MKKDLLHIFKDIDKLWCHILKNVKIRNVSTQRNASYYATPSKYLHKTISTQINRTKYTLTVFIASIKLGDVEYSIPFKIYSKGSPHNMKLIGSIALLLPCYFSKRSSASITIIMTPFKKKLPNKKLEMITSEHTNSGYCSGNEIVIYREEEHEKVLLHEMIHALGLDHMNIDYSDLIEKLNVKDGTQLNINEAFTEFWTNIIYTMIWVSNNFKKHKEKKLMEHLEHDKRFSLLQIAKILNHFKYKNYRDLFKTSHSSNCTFSQDTNVFSYYILKGCLLHNLEDWCEPEKQVLFKISNECLKKITEQLKEQAFSRRVDDIFLLLPKIQNKTLLKTMRMTYHG